jgi:hypothetical protein
MRWKLYSPRPNVWSWNGVHGERKIARGDAMRAEIILLAATGYTNSAIARSVGATRSLMPATLTPSHSASRPLTRSSRQLNAPADAPSRFSQKPGRNFESGH